MKKKWNVILILSCLSLLIGACAAEKSPSNTADNISKSNKETEVKPYQSNLDMIQPQAYSNVIGLQPEKGSYVSIIGKASGGEYWEAVKKGAEQACADMNAELGYEGKDKIKVTYSGPAAVNDVDEQVNILDEELARYPIAIGIASVDAKACEVQFDLAAESDIPVVAFDSGSEYPGLLSTIATDNDGSARAAADRLVESMGHEGNIAVFVENSKSKADMERENGFVDQINTQHPGVNIANVYRMDQLSQLQQQVADEINAGTYQKDAEEEKDTITEEDVIDYIFAKYPDIKGCFGTSADATMTAVEGVERAKAEDIKIVGYDVDSAQVKAMEDGKITGLIAQNPFGMGYGTVVAGIRASMKTGNEAAVHTGHTWVTKKSLKEESVQKILY